MITFDEFPMNPVLADHALACRLERAEALANARYVEARARLAPASQAGWIAVAGTYAMFDGPDSPSTQTFGLGLDQLPSAGELALLEAFFEERHAPVLHEISPFSDRRLPEELSKRGYRPRELTNVLFLPLPRVPGVPEGDCQFRVRLAGAAERQIWAATAAEGWSASGDIAGTVFDVMLAAAEVDGLTLFLVENDRTPVAAGALAIHDRVALFAGASTIPAWRRRGAQRALLEHRLRYAAEAGCDLAMICAEPGGSSQRNAERQGFRIAYTRTKWVLMPRRNTRRRAAAAGHR